MQIEITPTLRVKHMDPLNVRIYRKRAVVHSNGTETVEWVPTDNYYQSVPVAMRAAYRLLLAEESEPADMAGACDRMEEIEQRLVDAVENEVSR